MATVKPRDLGADAPPARRARGNVPPTHPTVWAGLALAVVGLLLAVFAYTGSRVYEIGYALVALGGALLALVGIFVAAWGRSVMASRASRSRRAAFSADALALSRRPSEETSSTESPTVAAPPARERPRLPFGFGKRKKADEEARGPEPIPAGVFAFRRRAEPAPEAREPEPAPEPAPEAELPPAPSLEPDAPLITLHEPVRVTLRCPQCSTTFTAEGVRPFEAACGGCGFQATV